MIRSFQRFGLAWLVMVAATYGAQAFSLLGPFKSWQVVAIGYQMPYDLGGPMSRFEGYRWNITNIYYACDQSWQFYFGARGIAEVDKAFDVFNSLTNYSAMSADLHEFPQTDMLRENYLAGALGLYDVKSEVLQILVEEMGLGDPIRFTWTLRGRSVDGNPPITNYSVVKLNYDPVTISPSSYVNGSLYGYVIQDPIPVPLNPAQSYADAVERNLDTIPFANGDPTPVASFLASSGQFWEGLTRDDVGGLRFLYRANNYAVETILPGSFVAITNRQAQVLVTNQDLPTFLRQTTHTTNNIPAVLALYPDAQINTSNSYLVAQLSTNLLFYFTNAPFSPLTNSQVIQTNTATNFVTYFDYTFLNVYTNTNTGSIYIVPANLLGYELITNLLTNIVAITNPATDFGFFVNTNAPVPIFTSNLALFASQSFTNSPAALQAMYPDLAISSYFYVLVSQAVTNYVFYLSYPPYAPAGITVPVFIPQVSNVLATNFYYTFANVITNTLFTNSDSVAIQQYRVYPAPFAPAGSGLVTTNVVTTLSNSNYVNGSFYIIPTNLVGYQLINTLQTNYVAISNFVPPVFTGTNFALTNVAITNVIGSNINVAYTNTAVITFGTNYTFAAYPVQPLSGTNFTGTNFNYRLTYFTNIYSAVYPIEFQSSSNSAFIRRGVDKIHFQNVTTNYDSLIGSFFTSITNQYVQDVITNSTIRQQIVRRVVGQPDILFISQDLGLVNNLTPNLTRATTMTNWINNDALNGQGVSGGPGVIPPQVQILFSDQLPYFLNNTPFFLTESATNFSSVVWGSFDGTTNAPVVYPDTFSIEELERLVLNPPNGP